MPLTGIAGRPLRMEDGLAGQRHLVAIPLRRPCFVIMVLSVVRGTGLSLGDIA